jgi:copper chaperone NosL
MISRRTFLINTLLASALAGCGQSGSSQPQVAAEIDAHSTCDLDGMLLADYPGPKAQIYYVGQKEPVFYCDTIELFHTLLAPEQVRAIQSVLVQDMGKADWEKPHGNWVDARTAIYVLGSKRHGSMGPTIASFATEQDAKKFAAEWGGKVVHYADIKPNMVDLSGGALHDTRM